MSVTLDVKTAVGAFLPHHRHFVRNLDALVCKLLARLLPIGTV
jgi:hypothetical protein